MRKRKHKKPFVAKQLTDAQQEKILKNTGMAIKAIREDRMKKNQLAYQSGTSYGQVGKYEAGGDMLLSTFHKVLHGLGMTPEEFFKALKK